MNGSWGAAFSNPLGFKHHPFIPWKSSRPNQVEWSLGWSMYIYIQDSLLLINGSKPFGFCWTFLGETIPICWGCAMIYFHRGVLNQWCFHDFERFCYVCLWGNLNLPTSFLVKSPQSWLKIVDESFDKNIICQQNDVNVVPSFSLVTGEPWGFLGKIGEP